MEPKYLPFRRWLYTPCSSSDVRWARIPREMVGWWQVSWLFQRGVERPFASESWSTKSFHPKRKNLNPSIWVFPKIRGFHQIIHGLIGFFHDFHHPFWGTLIFGNIHIVKNHYPPGNGYISHRPGSLENHRLKMPFLGGYDVSSLEGSKKSLRKTDYTFLKTVLGVLGTA